MHGREHMEPIFQAESSGSHYFPNNISDSVMNIITSRISGMEQINDFAVNLLAYSYS